MVWVQLYPFGLEGPKPEPQDMGPGNQRRDDDQDGCRNPVYSEYIIVASLGIDLIEAIVEAFFDETKYKGDHIEYHEHDIPRHYAVRIANLVSGLSVELCL